MASIVKRNNRYCVVYTYKHTNGTLKQKWETFTDLSDAKNRKKEVEYKELVGTFIVPQCKPLNDLLPEYVALYGKSKWALSTYQANTALIAKLHSSTHRLDEVAGYLHSCDRGVLSAAAQI
jgi:hypothetical protein